MCGPDGEMWAKEGRSLCDLWLGEGRKAREKEGREEEGEIAGVFQALLYLV